LINELLVLAQRLLRSFDLDLPIECDDEYWENPDPNLAFKQPPGKPSTVAYFNSSLQLGHVMGYVLRTIVRARPSM
jgi:hypothetical protein